MAPFAASRAGCRLAAEEEPEAYAALRGRAAESDGPRPASDPKFSVTAFPIGRPTPCGVVVCSLAEQVAVSPGRMERAFAAAARELLDALGSGPLRDLRTGAAFSTTRRAGDGVLRVNDKGRVAYASPNAVPSCGSPGSRAGSRACGPRPSPAGGSVSHRCSARAAPSPSRPKRPIASQLPLDRSGERRAGARRGPDRGPRREQQLRVKKRPSARSTTG